MVLLLILFLLLSAYEYRRQLVEKKNKKTDGKNYSESILQKRIKRFKSIKRGYYSLIGLVLFYVLSMIAPLWINDKPLMVQYKNGIYDEGEIFIDENKNNIWDTNEQFEDKYEAFYPAFWELIEWIPGVTPPIYEAEYFNQDTGNFEVDFKLLAKTCKAENNGNYVIMPIYPYHPHEDLKDELDEEYIDQNQNGQYDLGEPFTDENTHFFGGKNGVWDKNNPPTSATGFDGRHIFGTDTTGRDVFARIVDGFKVSITFAIICTFLSYSLGIMIGATLGYFGRWIDLFGVRIMEIFSSLPFLFIIMILSGFMQPNIYILAAILVFLSGWIGISYFVRGEFYREKAKDYVSAAVSMGASNRRVMFKHILPNALTPIITFGPFAIIGYIGTLNMLDLLGYGLQPPAASWGEILKQALENLDNWWLLLFPVMAMTITLFMITFIGEAIREAFDPKVYSRLR